MNLQQLNQSGQQLWVFICTASVSLVLTGGTWFCIDQFNGFRNWRRDRSVRTINQRRYSKFNLMVRIFLLCRLWLRTRTLWIFRSNAWYHVVTNSSVHGFITAPGTLREYHHLTALEYIYRGFQEYKFLSPWFENVKWRIF